MGKPFVFTIGHSTRPIDDFIHLLKSHGVQRLVDVRTLPRSRFNPHFDIARLPGFLRTAHIHYTHLPGLGGSGRVERRGTRDHTMAEEAHQPQVPRAEGGQEQRDGHQGPP